MLQSEEVEILEDPGCEPRVEAPLSFGPYEGLQKECKYLKALIKLKQSGEVWIACFRRRCAIKEPK